MYSPWKYHNDALKNPEYLMDGLMDCMREEMSFSMPYRSLDGAYPQESEPPEPQWNKRQWGEVQQLKAQVLFLSSKVNKMRAKASKRKKTRY